MDIDKKELNVKIKDGDINFVLDCARQITNHLIYNTKVGKAISQYDLFDDAMQECQITVFRAYENGKFDLTKNVFSYIWTSCYNKMQDMLRSFNRKHPYIYEEYTPIPDDRDKNRVPLNGDNSVIMYKNTLIEISTEELRAHKNLYRKRVRNLKEQIDKGEIVGNCILHP